MNELIKQLAEQAGKYADETQPRGSYTRDGMWLYAYNEKFAELIIQECCDIFVELRTRPADLAVKDVKKHFEIK